MRSDTQTITINAAPKAVIEFVGNGQNLPKWAIGFAKAVRPANDRWIVTTGQGELALTIDVHEPTGTVDFCIEPAPGIEATAYARAVPNGEGTEFLFTQLQHPGISDEMFGQLVQAVSHELIALRALLEVSCPL
jgi:hypothetical protein